MYFNKELLKVLVLKDLTRTPEQIAAKLKINLSTFYNWMSGSHEPDAVNLCNLAKFYDRDTDDFIKKINQPKYNKKIYEKYKKDLPFYRGKNEKNY